MIRKQSGDKITPQKGEIIMSSEKEKKTFDPKKTEIFESVWNSFTDEQKETARTHKDVKELAALLCEAGGALSDEMLDDVAGGAYYEYNEATKMYDVFLKDGYRIDTFGREVEASGVAEFYSFLEERGEI